MNTVDLNRLRVFFTVCQSRSVTKAAHQLHITRSAVSQQVTKLEDELGIALFMRTNRNVIPTPEAEALYPLVRDFIAGIQEMKISFEVGKHEPTGKIRVGAPIVFGETFVIDAVAKFKKRYPHTSFELSFMNQPWLLSEKVLAGEIELAIIDLINIVQKQLPVSAQPLIIERQALVGSKDILGPWKNKYIPYDELVRFPIIDYLPKGEATKLWFRKMYDHIPGELNVVFSCENLYAMIRGAKEGLGLGLIPTYLIQKELKSEQLIKVMTRKSEYENRIGIVQAPDRKPSLAERIFVNLIADEMKKRGQYL